MSEPSKQDIRQRLRSLPTPGPDADERINSALQSLPELFEGPILAFLQHTGEPNVDAWIIHALDRGMTVCTPRVAWEEGRMEAAVLRGHGDWSEGRHGLREPAAEAPIVPIEDLRAVLAPGVAFDLHGRRLGRGGGFYDRFLARLDPRTVRIGVGFEARVIDRLPADPWDQPIHVLVTESCVRRFSPAD